jgi:CubicO group peptidase (beta-lactamase class C family)
LQQLLVDICKTPFPDLMREIVLDPHGMADSTFEQPLPDGLRERAVAGTLLSGEVPRGGWRIHPEMAAAGLWTTPADLARFVVELQLSRLGRPSRVLSREISALMLTPYRALPADLAPYLGTHCGLGMFIEWRGRSVGFSHSGGNAGYVAYMVGDFSGNGAVVMTSSGAMELMGEVLLGIARSFHWEFDLPGLPSVTPT